MTKITEERVWKKHFPKQSLSAQLPKMSIYAYLKHTNRDRLDAVALYYYGAKITHRQLIRRIDQCADAFHALGVTAGSTVSLLSGTTPESLISLYALNKLGAVVNCIDPRMDVQSIRRMICEANTRMLVTIDLAYPKVHQIRTVIGQKYIVVQSAATSLPPLKKLALRMAAKAPRIDYSDTVLSWESFLEKGKGTHAKEAAYQGDATVAITYTGGTTGFPKGVMLTNDSMNAVSINFIHCGLVYEKGQRFLGIMPIFSSYGMVCGLHMPLTLGLELALIPRFVPAKMGALVKQFRPEHMIATPAFYEIMMNSKEVKDLDLSFIITMGSGGDTMNAGLEEKLHRFMREHNIRYPLAQGYGMSELSAAASFCVNDRYKPGSVGIPCLTTVVGIFDPETGEELGYDQEGEVCMTGPSMMKGYFNRPEETAHVMRRHADGRIWVHSGDIGYMDTDGFLFIQGRIKRMITRFDGHKVFPVNIEACISSHPDVYNCSVIGVDDRDRTQGQYPLALIELRKGADVEKTCRETFELCQNTLEERGKPVGVIAVDEIPLTGVGKNDYRALEQLYGKFDYKTLTNGVKLRK